MAVRLRRAELDREAREFAARLWENIPEPVPVNVDALLLFTQPREFVWGGVGYRAPPVPFVLRVRMLVAANAIRDLRTADLPLTGALHHACQDAALLLRTAVHPTHWLLRRVWHRAHRAFTTDAAEELEGLLLWLLHVPDATAVEPPGRRAVIDFMDGVAAFARDLPAWCTADGLPLSWAHYVHGQRHLSRAVNREAVRGADAARAAQANGKDFERWLADRQRAAGW